MSTAHSIIALLHGPDQPGLVAKVSNWIWQREGNILHADQHRDNAVEIFFQRVEWIPNSTDLRGEIAEFKSFASELNMKSNVVASSERAKVAMFVSKYDHCFHDIILRWKAGEFNGDICCVISNHDELKTATEIYGIPFHHIKVTRDNKIDAESEQIKILLQYEVDIAILARYMQVLSSDFLRTWGKPVINVHHSFLPAFAGARPYHQAYSRGVKVIGATAHYATADLDEGPIITQAVAPVNHRHMVEDLVRKGRDLEKMVLSQALRFHLERRILCYDNKTVVFD